MGRGKTALKGRHSGASCLFQVAHPPSHPQISRLESKPQNLLLLGNTTPFPVLTLAEGSAPHRVQWKQEVIGGGGELQPPTHWQLLLVEVLYSARGGWRWRAFWFSVAFIPLSPQTLYAHPFLLRRNRWVVVFSSPWKWQNMNLIWLPFPLFL